MNYKHDTRIDITLGDLHQIIKGVQYNELTNNYPTDCFKTPIQKHIYDIYKTYRLKEYMDKILNDKNFEI